MIVTRTSPFSGKRATMDLAITEQEVQNYKDGALLQNAFPNIDAGEREFYKTGITSQEWDSMFGGPE